MTNTLSNAFKVSIQIRDFICYVDQYTHCNFFLAFWIIHLSFLITLINNSLSLHPLILQLLSVTTFLGAAFCFGAFLCRNVNGFLILFSIGELLVFATQVLSFYARKISVFNCYFKILSFLHTYCCSCFLLIIRCLFVVLFSGSC
jgi:hypothetical protein